MRNTRARVSLRNTVLKKNRVLILNKQFEDLVLDRKVKRRGSKRKDNHLIHKVAQVLILPIPPPKEIMIN